MSTTLVCSFVCLDTHTCLNIHRSANAQSAGLHAPSLSPMRFITLILILPFFQEQMTPLPHTHTHTHTHTHAHTLPHPLALPPSLILHLSFSLALVSSLPPSPASHWTICQSPIGLVTQLRPGLVCVCVCVCVCLRVCVGCVGVTFTSCTCKIH